MCRRSESTFKRGRPPRLLLLASLLACLVPFVGFELPAVAQQPSSSSEASQEARLDEAQRRAEAALASEPDSQPAGEVAALPTPDSPKINMLELFRAGGYLMYPIVFMSIVVLMFGLDRGLALRRGKVIPRALSRGLKEATASEADFDPRAVFGLCRQKRSAAATVISAAILKTGRPEIEVARAASEASEREAARLYKNVRPIMLAVTITPLMGLLGTVWGMIEAFFVTASNPVGVNRAESLASGIYQALMTTFAGLAVAIPAAILAHYFEGRIQNIFRDIDDLIDRLLPQIARFDGKVGPDFRAKLQQSADRPKRRGRRAPDPLEKEAEPVHTT